MVAHDGEPRLWRLHSDATNSAFVRDAAGGRHFAHALKTDLFDEAVTDGVVPAIRGVADEVTGVDISDDVVERARRRHPGVRAEAADVRRLPFEDGAFDLVVSLSTLDHLESVAEIARGVRELRRVLRPGGILLLTVDNRANPVVALRNALPQPRLRAAGLVAYSLGATVGPRELDRMVRSAGLRPVGGRALMHCPRLPAIAVARRTGGSSAARDRLLRAARRFDALDRLPTRYVTGYFAAIVAER